MRFDIPGNMPKRYGNKDCRYDTKYTNNNIGNLCRYADNYQNNEKDNHRNDNWHQFSQRANKTLHTDSRSVAVRRIGKIK